jgi:hypothetical protein
LSAALSEALDQQKATFEVLRVISNSSIDLRSALEAIAESAARLLDVTDADIMRVEGDALRLIAKHGPSQQRPVGSIRPINRDWVAGRAVIDRTTVQVPDLQAAESDANAVENRRDDFQGIGRPDGRCPNCCKVVNFTLISVTWPNLRLQPGLFSEP